MTKQKLVRSRERRMIAGVCGGLAEYFNVEATWIRLGALIASLFSAGIVVAIYIVAWLIIPDAGSGETGADQLYDRYGDYKRRRAARETTVEPDQPTDTFRADDEGTTI